VDTKCEQLALSGAAAAETAMRLQRHYAGAAAVKQAQGLFVGVLGHSPARLFKQCYDGHLVLLQCSVSSAAQAGREP